MGWTGLEDGIVYLKSMVDSVPEEPGVYLICDKSSGYPKLQYIGMSGNLQERLQQHLDDADEGTNQALHEFMTKQGTVATREDKAFFFWVTENEDKAKGREASLLEQCFQQEGYYLLNQQGSDAEPNPTPLPKHVKYLGNWVNEVKR